MNILGISCFYHDSSAALMKDGEIVAAAQEERFTRKKHDTSFPKKAIEYCLKSQNLSIEDIDYIGFYEKPLLKFERILHMHLQSFPKSYRTFLMSIPQFFTEKLRITKIIKKELNYKKPVLFIEHHLAHAAGSFLISPYKKAAIFTIDGVGEWTTTAYGIGINNDINLNKEIKFPSSIGLLYSTITAYLGFSVNNSEYKVMGLSPYGNRDRNSNQYYPKLKQVMDVKEDGSYQFDMSYFTYHYKNKMPSKKLCNLLGGPIRKPESQITERHKDIAAALQMLTEDVLIKILNHVHKITQADNLIMSGGVALNSVANGKILKNTNFKNIWIQPDPGDGGTSIGVAAYIYHTILNKPRTNYLKTAYLGPQFSSIEIKKFLDKNNIKYSEFKNPNELIDETAKLIHTNNVIGWFQGRMEWGPRALGSRSILSNATNPKMQEILNLKVKHRERFRPYAPVVCSDDSYKYFETDNPVPLPTDFMLMVYPIKKEYHDKIPSVTHVDGSGRLQTVRKDQNPLYYYLLKKFGSLSGIPILINTSFNIRGEPIVCTPYDAYKCMMGTEIDYLIMGKYLIKRLDNKNDLWDSEKYAKD